LKSTGFARPRLRGSQLLNNSFKTLESIFARFRREKAVEPPDPRFVDLAPKEFPEAAGIYLDALNTAIIKEDVLNIALTGPYGSGKSSVIKTFLRQYKKPYLQLSLASFVPDGGQIDRVTKQEIERSILQQILYGVDAAKLPFSRFKRIKAPKKISVGTSLIITIGLYCSWYLFSKQTEILSGKLFEPRDWSNWFNYLSVVAVGLFAWKVVHSAYVNSLGLSLKSISLKDVQIAPAATDQESILNRHLDEILYFFQSTKYELVVIEDLDRFDTPDIFVSLREINGLVNANEGMNRRVKFLYALRDDIFVNTDRTKFFEFIVPIIPIINHSNSIDKLLEHSQRIGLDSLDKQFVREVSRYLSDLRLIQNILNEYVVYDAKLTADEDGRLDSNKLLAIIIYKNVMPKDFAALHRQEGVLASVLRRHDEFVSDAEQKLRGEIAQIKAHIVTGEEQELRDEADLRKVYAMAVIERLPENYQQLFIQDDPLRIAQLTEDGVLETLLQTKKKVSVNIQRPGYHPNRVPVDLKDLETSVDPTRTFEVRKVDIGSKSAKFRRESEKRISELETRLSSLRTRRFNEVVRESPGLIDQVFAEVGENVDLLKYLILEGHIDDTYYQYISLFHSGRLSPKDNSFLIKIRAYNTPPPDFPLDNVAEVVASMRPGDFGQTFVLNRSIVDHLLADEVANASRIGAAVGLISANFQACGDFFRIYYATGTHVDKLVRAVLTKWPNFASIVVDESDGASHVARILAYASDKVSQLPASREALRKFLASNADRVLAEGLEFTPGLLRLLEVEIEEVEKLVDFPDILSFVAQEGLYRISIDNLACIVRRVSGEKNMEALKKRHFSTLNEVNDSALLKRLVSDFSTYVADVLLALPANTDEDISAIAAVLARDDVEHNLRVEFLNKQTAIFPNLSDIPTEFQRFALEGRHVEPTWENCLQFMSSEAYDADLLTAYIQTQEAAAALGQQMMPNGEPALVLQRFVLNNDGIRDPIYRVYVQRIPIKFTGFPDVGSSKKSILIEERKVTFTPTSFQQLDDVALKVQFVAKNFDTYAAAKPEYMIDDDFRGRLLHTSIMDAQKLNVLADIDEAYVAGTPSVAAVVGPLLARTQGAPVDYGAEFIKAIALHSQDIRTKLTVLNRMHLALSVPEIRDVLQAMPMPYQGIATFGKAPKLEDNELNRQLAHWLKDREVISSFSEPLLGGELKINTFRKGPE
jgi:hypothetical protein